MAALRFPPPLPRQSSAHLIFVPAVSLLNTKGHGGAATPQRLDNESKQASKQRKKRLSSPCKGTLRTCQMSVLKV